MASPNLSHKNNFDFLRLSFAAMVIVTHSLALTGMNEWQNDWLSGLTKSQMTLSYIAVRGFFIISGYLIYQSLTRSRNVVDYFWKRILRIFPGLIVLLLLTVILAVIPYPYGWREYLKNPSVSNYFFNNLSLFKLQYSIDGLFQDNPVKGVINGSLWTIPYEFFFYILFAVLIFFKRGLGKYVVLFAFLLLLNLFFFKDLPAWSFLYLDSKYLVELGLFFVSGAVLASVGIEHFSHKRTLFFFALTLLLLSIHYSNFHLFQFITLPLVVILFGQSSIIYISNISNRFGDLSYGMYIYGYPVEQTLEHYFRFSHFPLMVYSLLITLVLGYFSWHLVEKRALRLKRIDFLSRIRKMLSGPEKTSSYTTHKQEAKL